MKIVKTVCLMLLLFCLPLSAHGESAREISGTGLVTEMEHADSADWLFDGDSLHCPRLKPHLSLTLKDEEGIGSLYLLFAGRNDGFQVINREKGEIVPQGQEGFLHDYCDLTDLFGKAPKSVTLQFGENPPQLAELRVFTEGETPADVQKWKLPPEKGVDLMVLPAHGDDEQLFFAGLLPYYAGEKEYEVQVVYSTDHHNCGPLRPHEMLDGLWAVGVRNYPVFGPFPDFYSKSEEAALQKLEYSGYLEEDVRGFLVEQIRHFKPLVVVGHDLNGEYGHGFHRLYGHMAALAAEQAGDSEKFPKSAAQYGVWDVPKTYLHLYGENQIRMNWDVPLQHFDGETAYEVSKEEGYPAHKSQYSGFIWYFNQSENAAGISRYSPCVYGLFRSTVGADQRRDDLFENLLSRKEQKELEIREKQREARALAIRQQEKERQLAQKREQERRERLADEETRKLQTAAAEERYEYNMLLVFCSLLAAVSLALLLWIFLKERRNKK